MSESDKTTGSSEAPNKGKTAEKPVDPKAPPPEVSKLDGVELDDIELVEIKAFA